MPNTLWVMSVDTNNKYQYVPLTIGTNLALTTGTGYALTLDASGGVGGGVQGPATNTDAYIPQWNGANSNTLKDGLAVPAGGLAGLTALAGKLDTGGTAADVNVSGTNIAAALSGKLGTSAQAADVNPAGTSIASALSGKQATGAYALNNQTFYLGSTSIAINRTTGNLALSGITSIDGSAATLTNSRNIGGRSFNGSADIIADTWKNGIATKNTADASTTQNIAHGLGRVPSFVRLTGMLVITALTEICMGVYNGTTNSCSSACMTEGSTTATTDNLYTSTTQAIGFTNAGATSPFGGAASQTGVVTFDATNIIITWTKTGTITGTANILWECT